MRSVLVDKIASVALQADLGQEIRVADEIPCEEGVLIAFEVLNNKSRYNTLELTSGRMAEVKKGDVVEVEIENVGLLRNPIVDEA